MTIAANPPGASDVRPGRLDEATLKGNFADLHPVLTPHEARVEAERCYFCYDPPCQQACPTSIDIPLFIRQIAAGNPLGRGEDDLRLQHHGRHVRPRLPDRNAVRGSLRARGGGGKAGRRSAVAALCDRPTIGTREIALCARRADRQAGGDRRRGAGGAGLRASNSPSRRREHDLRSAREGGRPQRIRHRRLQDGRRFRRARKSISFFRSAASRSSTARRSAAT